MPDFELHGGAHDGRTVQVERCGHGNWPALICQDKVVIRGNAPTSTRYTYRETTERYEVDYRQATTTADGCSHPTP